VVKAIIYQCLPCYRFKAQASKQLMGELPSTRVQPARPFLTTGVDYAGPISLRLGSPRSKVITKGYIAICLFCNEGYSSRVRDKPHHRGISCCPAPLHCSSRTSQNHSFRQRNQFQRSIKSNASYLHHAAVVIPDGNDPGLPVQRRM
jgi:hypothetical protein